MVIDSGFKLFASNVEQALKKNKLAQGETLLERQRAQLKKLIRLETEFRDTLIRHQWGAAVYREFVTFICETRRNILSARPFFRERQEVFSAEITTAFKRRADKELYGFRVNYNFIRFALRAKSWSPKSRIRILAKQVESIRTEILEMTLPLALSQTRIFWNCIPKSHLSYMDLVQIHVGGLMVGIDKFVPPNTVGMTDEQELQEYRRFRAVVIGRMVGDRIDANNETLMHYYPPDKRRLYRANKARRHFAGDIDYEKLVAIVNKDIPRNERAIGASELAELMASSSLAGDIIINEEGETVLDYCQSPESSRPDTIAEAADTEAALRAAHGKLSVFERKILKLKGVQL